MFRWIFSAKLAGATPSHITRTNSFCSTITYISISLSDTSTSIQNQNVKPLCKYPKPTWEDLSKALESEKSDFHFVLGFIPFHCHKKINLTISMFKKFAHIYLFHELFLFSLNLSTKYILELSNSSFWYSLATRL